ncbi:hypothetical protein [Maricaulis sp.]|uniref:hypothetical protein n=1 Tax=Maricaulis sp. TaxID=1486257 RepID=UPI002B27728C|nr:hypothetical protein [Maricaulis sp.]
MTSPQARDLLDALGLAEKRRVASGRYVTANIGPAENWLYFVTYRTRSGFWFGVCPRKAQTKIRADVLTFLEKEGFEPTSRNFEAIRLVGKTVQ